MSEIRICKQCHKPPDNFQQCRYCGVAYPTVSSKEDRWTVVVILLILAFTIYQTIELL